MSLAQLMYQRNQMDPENRPKQNLPLLLAIIVIAAIVILLSRLPGSTGQVEMNSRAAEQTETAEAGTGAAEGSAAPSESAEPASSGSLTEPR